MNLWQTELAGWQAFKAEIEDVLRNPATPQPQRDLAIAHLQKVQGHIERLTTLLTAMPTSGTSFKSLLRGATGPSILRYHDGQQTAICEVYDRQGTLLINGQMIGTYPTIGQTEDALKQQGISISFGWKQHR